MRDMHESQGGQPRDLGDPSSSPLYKACGPSPTELDRVQPAGHMSHAGVGLKRGFAAALFQHRLYESGAPTCSRQTWPSQVM